MTVRLPRLSEAAKESARRDREPRPPRDIDPLTRQMVDASFRMDAEKALEPIDAEYAAELIEFREREAAGFPTVAECQPLAHWMPGRHVCAVCGEDIDFPGECPKCWSFISWPVEGYEDFNREVGF